MTPALDGLPSNSSLVLTHPTPSLTSTPLVALSNGAGSGSNGVTSPLASIAAPGMLVTSPVVSPLSPSLSGPKPPSVRSAAVAVGTSVVPSTPTASKAMLPTTPSSSRLSLTSSGNHNVLPTRLVDLSTSIATPLPSTHVISSVTRSPSPSASPSPGSSSNTLAPSSSKVSTSSVVPSKASTNSTVGTGSSRASLAQPVVSKAANVTSSVSAHVSVGSATAHTFVPQVSTSDTLPFTSTTKVSSPTNKLGNFTHSSGFFANRGAVAGVFVVVGLAVMGLAALLFFGWKRYCLRPRNGYIGEPTLPMLEPSHNDDMHYRRASQMRALGDVLSAGASRPLSGHSVPSDDSHTFSRQSHHSTDPIVPSLLNRYPEQHADAGPSQGYSHGYPDGYKNVIAFPPPTKPFATQSRVSMQSAWESSPSIYPPTLPSVAEEEEHYWRQQGFEHVSDSPESERIVETRTVQQQHTPPESMLGLWSNVSHSTVQHHSISEENELIRSLDPRMQPTSVHKGSTAPIASPPKLQLHDGRHPIIGDWMSPHRQSE